MSSGAAAGATAAADLARGGRTVLLLDRGGRIKPCGGAIPPRCVRDFGIPDSLIVARANAARIVSPTDKHAHMPIEGGYVGMVDREHFDEWLRERAVAAGAEGTGLVRSEFLFDDRAEPPTEDEQFEIYRKLAEGFGGLPVVLRTLDAGGDKPLRFVRHPAEANPFLGLRGLRLCLANPELFRPQIRAALRAARHGDIRIMLPMVDGLADLRAAGWERIELRPFLMPQRAVLPRPLQAALDLLEPLPGARYLTKVRFPMLVSASG